MEKKSTSICELLLSNVINGTRLQSSQDEINAGISLQIAYKNPTISIPRSGGDGEMPFSSHIGASRLTMQQRGKARFRNARENNFACAKPGSRSRSPSA